MKRIVLTAVATTALAAAIAPAVAQDTLVIGTATALTGGLAYADVPAMNGMQLAVEEINAAGGIAGKFKIEIRQKDSRSDPAQAAVAAQELIDEGISVLVTPCDADPSIGAGQIAQGAGIPAFYTPTAVGMATVGLVTSPQMGRVADEYAHERIPVERTVELFGRAQGMLGSSGDPDAVAAVVAGNAVLEAYSAARELPAPETANALRALIASDADAELVAEANAILGPADNYGGRISFRFVVPLCAILFVIFLALYARDRAAGGYRVERIEVSA